MADGRHEVAAKVGDFFGGNACLVGGTLITHAVRHVAAAENNAVDRRIVEAVRCNELDGPPSSGYVLNAQVDAPHLARRPLGGIQRSAHIPNIVIMYGCIYVGSGHQVWL